MKYDKKDILKKINMFFDTTDFSSVEEAEFLPRHKKILLYPTDDLLLNEKQFSALSAIMDEHEKLYILDDGYHGNYCSTEFVNAVDVNRITVLEPPLCYKKYSGMALNPVCIMFPESFKWIIVVDEMLDNGVAILAGDASTISKFKSQYESHVHDVIAFTEYCLEQHQKRGTNLDWLLKIIRQIR